MLFQIPPYKWPYPGTEDIYKRVDGRTKSQSLDFDFAFFSPTLRMQKQHPLRIEGKVDCSCCFRDLVPTSLFPTSLDQYPEYSPSLKPLLHQALSEKSEGVSLKGRAK